MTTQKPTSSQHTSLTVDRFPLRYADVRSSSGGCAKPALSKIFADELSAYCQKPKTSKTA
jgi:hypothetical protein